MWKDCSTSLYLLLSNVYVHVNSFLARLFLSFFLVVISPYVEFVV